MSAVLLGLLGAPVEHLVVKQCGPDERLPVLEFVAAVSAASRFESSLTHTGLPAARPEPWILLTHAPCSGRRVLRDTRGAPGVVTVALGILETSDNGPLRRTGLTLHQELYLHDHLAAGTGSLSFHYDGGTNLLGLVDTPIHLHAFADTLIEGADREADDFLDGFPPADD